jgi:hypothetical protein
MKHTTITKEMTIEEIRIEADKAGFVPVTFEKNGYIFIKTSYCKQCKEDSMLTFSSEEKGGKYHTARACTCGYREFFGWGFDKKTSTNEGKKPIQFVNKCVTNGCNNTLPPDRKSYCYTCRPKAKKISPTLTKESQSGEKVIY